MVSKEIGLELKGVDMSMLGRARQVRATREFTVIVGGSGDSQKNY